MKIITRRGRTIMGMRSLAIRSEIFAVVLCLSPPVVSAEIANDNAPEITAVELPIQASIDQSDALTDAERSIGKRDAGNASEGHWAPIQLAQFQVPKGKRDGVEPSLQLPAALKFQYAFGSDSEILYLKDRDLNKRVRDNSIIASPTFFTLMTYRPNAWLETTLEVTLSRNYSIKEEPEVTLPDGSVVFSQKRNSSLLVDQLFATFKDFGPFDVSVGRRNFEDGRLWLYDVALDALVVKHKHETIHTDVSISRENLWDGELHSVNVPKGKINNTMVYSEYRGIEDHKLAAYAIERNDLTKKEGHPLLLGARGYGRPSDSYNYWADLGFSRGRDESSHRYMGYAYDIGNTYRFKDHPFQPTFTLGYAYGSGDNNSDDNVNYAYRQTGLQSNEGRFGGVTQFKIYGEMLDPELSNIRILTAGFSLRPAANAFVDLVYHRYELIKVATELRSSGITALMNQDSANPSRDVGQALDLIVGFRNLFGFRKFGFEARIGWFFPGDAFRNLDGSTYRKADKGVSGLFVIIL